MRKFQLADSFFYLPIFLLVLPESPNFAGWTIGLTFVSTILLLIPTANYLGQRIAEVIVTEYRFSILDILFLFGPAAIVYIGLKFEPSFLIFELLYLFTFLIMRYFELSGQNKVSTYLLPGFLLYITIYLGLNNYSWVHLLNTKLIRFGFLAIVLYMLISLSGSFKKLTFPVRVDAINRLIQQVSRLMRLFILLFVAFLGIYYNGWYILIFLVTSLPVIVAYYGLVRKIETGNYNKIERHYLFYRILLAVGLMVFLAYFFLDSTQVLQAVQAGY